MRALTAAVSVDGRDGRPASASILAHLARRPFTGLADADRYDLAWRQIAAAWRVAEASGAPLADCLHSFVLALRAADEASRDVQVALSGPRATARVVLALPPVGLLLSLGMGFDTGAVLVGTPIGWACLAVGAGLVAVAGRWNARLVRAALPSSRVPGLRLELLALALSGGASWASGLAAVDEAVSSGRDEAPRGPVGVAVDAARGEASGGAESADDVADRDERRRCETVLLLSRRAGAPAGLLLRSDAREMRLEARSAAQAAAARLGVTLMLPLGVCVLPAFLVVGVVPLVVSLVSSTTGAW